MSHFAKVENGVVTDVIVAEQDFIDTLPDAGSWVKTSYNIRGGVYYDPETNEPSADQNVINDDEGRKRKNYAKLGDTYDLERNAFYEPQPSSEYVLNEATCLWELPE